MVEDSRKIPRFNRLGIILFTNTKYGILVHFRFLQPFDNSKSTGSVYENLIYLYDYLHSFVLDLLGTSFLNFLLDMIEEPPVMDEEDQIPELFVNLILSYNLQFSIPTENVVLDAFEQRRVAKIFTEKILLLLNREGT